MAEPTWDEEVDFLVVGSGGGGMLSAILAAQKGQRALVVEREPRWGGTSAYSGGGMWMPINPLMIGDGLQDSPEKVLEYMDHVIGDVGPASSPARRRAYVEHAKDVVAWMLQQGMPVLRADKYPDYYPDKPGGMIGRSVELDACDGKQLGPWLPTIATMPGMPPLALRTAHARYFPLVLRTWEAFFGMAKVVLRSVAWLLTGRRPLGLGQALLGHLMIVAQRAGVEVWLESPMVSLVEEDGAIVGAVVERAGVPVRIRARTGVMITAGGFAKNAAFRKQHQPVGDEYTSAAPGDQGDAIRIGETVDAAMALMDDAWWGPTFMFPGNQPMFAVHERSMPGCILVDRHGKRFANESASYVDVGHAMLDLNPGGPPPDTWLILDARHRHQYMLGMMPPYFTPASAYNSGLIKKAATLDALAAACGIDAEGLRRTVQRFNGFARSGVDEDFGRGNTAYDRYYGDPTISPNPNLAPIENAPFYAVRMVCGDLGTKGGLLTDEHARVLRTDGSPIPGLYASGNSTASVMGHTYPGAGATLGPALTFAWIGVHHAIRTRSERSA